MKKLIISVTMAAVCSMYISAQTAQTMQEVVHEYSAHIGGGMGAMRYNLPIGAQSGGAGVDFGVGYTLIFRNASAVETGTVSRSQWGIHTGFGFGFYGAKTSLNGETTINAGLLDSDRDFFDLHSTVRGYEETQRMTLLNIPVMGQHEFDRYYVMGGFKFGVPLNAKYRSNGARLDNEADYYEIGGARLKGPSFVGFGDNFAFDKTEGSLNYGVSVMLSLEAGVKWRINENIYVYTGAYFDYGLNNAAKNLERSPFVNYANNVDYDAVKFTANSILFPFQEKMNVMAVGVKVRVGFAR